LEEGRCAEEDSYSLGTLFHVLEKGGALLREERRQRGRRKTGLQFKGNRSGFSKVEGIEVGGKVLLKKGASLLRGAHEYYRRPATIGGGYWRGGDQYLMKSLKGISPNGWSSL